MKLDLRRVIPLNILFGRVDNWAALPERHDQLMLRSNPPLRVSFECNRWCTFIQVNTQLGEFTLRRHTMETLPQEIEDQLDFQAVFGVAEDSSRYSFVYVFVWKHL